MVKSNPLPLRNPGSREAVFPHEQVQLKPGDEVQIHLGNPMPAVPPGAPDMKISLAGSVFEEVPANAEHPAEYAPVTIRRATFSSWSGSR